eukprot:573156-Lingulodinium_polyedra.AAC.1
MDIVYVDVSRCRDVSVGLVTGQEFLKNSRSEPWRQVDRDKAVLLNVIGMLAPYSNGASWSKDTCT